jgi:uncharacterized protein YnzC (UPF0291/DUF896 family)
MNYLQIFRDNIENILGWLNILDEFENNEETIELRNNYLKDLKMYQEMLAQLEIEINS